MERVAADDGLRLRDRTRRDRSREPAYEHRHRERDGRQSDSRRRNIEQLDFSILDAPTTVYVDNQTTQAFYLSSDGTKFSQSKNFRIEDRIYHAVDNESLGLITWVANNVFVTAPGTASGTTTDTDSNIQRGIDVAPSTLTNLWTVNVEAGTFSQIVNVDKPIDLVGQGPNSTVISASSGDILTIAADNVSVTGLHVTGSSSTDGIYFDSTVTGDSLKNVVATNNNYGLEIANAAVVGTLALDTVSLDNNVVGFNVSTTGQVNGLTIQNSHFDFNTLGLATAAAGTSNQNGFTNIDILAGTIPTTFSNDTQKGIHVEKLDHATLDGIKVIDSGTDTTYGFNAGIDINLKYGAYTDITISNATLTGDGTGTLGTGEDLAIKGRDDSPSYNANPASLSTINLTNDTISGSPIDLSMGYAVSGITMLGDQLQDVSAPSGGIGLVYYSDASALNLSDTSFAGGLATYIENGSTFGIDATNGATFDGFNTGAGPVAGNLSTYFAIEDKIIDAIDVSGLGLVRLNTGNIFVTPNSFFAPTTTAPSSQRGVNAATLNDTVYVEDGTYPDSAGVSLTQGVTLLTGGATTLGSATPPPYDPLMVTSTSPVTISEGFGGTGTGTLNTGDLTLNSNTTYDFQINSLTPGTGYDQIVANGDINLGGATLHASAGASYTPSVGDVITVISNQGSNAVNGQFAGLGEGATVLIDNLPFSISYKGGTDGRDVTLTLQSSQNVYVNDTWVDTFRPGGPLTNGDTVATDPSQDKVTTLSGLTYGLNAFSTIQAAIAALNGNFGTVHVVEGTYNITSAITISDTLQIVGPQATVNPESAGRLADAGNPQYETIVNVGSGSAAFELTSANADSVSIGGLTIDGSGGSLQGIVENFGVSGTTITNNYIDGFGGDAVAGANRSSRFNISDNEMSSDYLGVFVVNTANHGTIAEDYIHGMTTGAGTGQGSGIELAGMNPSVTIDDNRLTGDAEAMFVANPGAGATLAGTTVFNNDLSGGTKGIVNNSGVLLDASGNWWGSSAAAIVSTAVGSNVDFTPWLAAGTNNATNGTAFVGDFSRLFVDEASPEVQTGGRINEALGLLQGGALTGGNRIIDVVDGTYVTPVTVNVPVDIIGNDAAGAIIAPTSGTAFTVTSNNVTLSQMTIKNATVNTNPNGGFGISANAVDNLSLQNLFVTGFAMGNVLITGGTGLTIATMDSESSSSSTAFRSNGLTARRSSI